ncbi:hypothetical protein ASE00_12480 [Sphingomonas sp. Root710]|uniref:hypothetical protein n=1 Tax=Sphingomonas sp. Root710 TaxID=1736594 RepID=UPI0006FEBA83|nr:hypothetical protein [Sphingomonas sp. Root710]KRB82829.1 hypothetical protein ASE00_12480 [Sphingomonas sp. Root710]
MKKQMSFLGGAGLAALAMLGAGTAAEAKPVHHTDAEFEALKAQVDRLTARLDAQDGAQRNATEQAAQAQAAAAAASERALAAQAAADAAAKAAPAEVKSQLASWKPKLPGLDGTSISGRMYFNISSISAKNGGVKTIGAGSLNGAGFNIKRFYLGVDHKFSDVFSGNVTMDVNNVIGQTANSNFQTPTATTGAAAGATTNVNNVALVGRGFYIKKAYLQAKINPALIIRFGAADLPWIPYVENQYGYRHIENTVADRLSFGTSSDWGVHVLGDLAGGLFSYQISVIDGGGYRNVKLTKSVDVEGRVSVAYKGFYAAGGGYAGKRANDVQGAVLSNGNDLHTASRIDGLIGYKNKLFTVGGEYFHAKNWNNVTTVATDKTDGYSVFGSINFAKTWSAFGRYDWVKPSKILNPTVKDQYFNFGIQWEPVKIVDLALVYKHDRARNGAIGTSNGTIGAATIGGKYSEIGLFGQLRF